MKNSFHSKHCKNIAFVVLLEVKCLNAPPPPIHHFEMIIFNIQVQKLHAYIKL